MRTRGIIMNNKNKITIHKIMDLEMKRKRRMNLTLILKIQMMLRL